MRQRKENFFKGGPKGPPATDYVAQGGPVLSGPAYTDTWAASETGQEVGDSELAAGVASALPQNGFRDFELHITPQHPAGLFVLTQAGDGGGLLPGGIEIWDWWGEGVLLTHETTPTAAQRWELIGACYDKSANKIFWMEATRDDGGRVNVDLRLWEWDVEAQGAAALVHEEVNAAVDDAITEVYLGVVQNGTRVACVASEPQASYDELRDDAYTIALSKSGAATQSGILGSYEGPVANVPIHYEADVDKISIYSHYQRAGKTRRSRRVVGGTPQSDVMEATLASGEIAESVVHANPTGDPSKTLVTRSVPVSAGEAMTVFFTTQYVATGEVYTYRHADGEAFDPNAQDKVDTWRTHTLLEP